MTLCTTLTDKFSWKRDRLFDNLKSSSSSRLSWTLHDFGSAIRSLLSFPFIFFFNWKWTLQKRLSPFHSEILKKKQVYTRHYWLFEPVIIGSAEALPILCVRYFWWEREREIQREREREKDGSDVTIVALKLAMNLHFPLPKIRTIGVELTLSLAKTSHFSILPSHFPSFPSRRGHHGMVALKFAMSSHFPLPKIFSPSGFVPPLSNGTSRATSDRKPKTNDQLLPSPILFFPSKNWIKLIPKTIGNRKRDCAWGGSGW